MARETIISSGRRSGQTTSADVNVRSDASGIFTIAIDVDPGAALDESAPVSVALEVWDGAAWVFNAGFAAHRGNYTDKDGVVRSDRWIGIPAAEVAGKRTRIVVTPTRATTFSVATETR